MIPAWITAAVVIPGTSNRFFRQMMEYAQGQGWIETLPVPKSEMQHARQKASPATKEEAAQPEVKPEEATEPEATAQN